MTYAPLTITFRSEVTLAEPNADTIERIESFSALETGWNYGRGHAPTKAIIDLAVRLLRFVGPLGFTSTDAVPGNSGEINIILTRFEHRVEILISADALATIYREENNKQVFESTKLAELECRAKLVDISGEIFGWPGYVYSTLSNLRVLVDITALHSGMTATALGQVYSANLAQSMILGACAPTPAPFTPDEEESLQPSGSLGMIYFLETGGWSRKAIRAKNRTVVTTK